MRVLWFLEVSINSVTDSKQQTSFHLVQLHSVVSSSVERHEVKGQTLHLNQ